MPENRLTLPEIHAQLVAYVRHRTFPSGSYARTHAALRKARAENNPKI